MKLRVALVRFIFVVMLYRTFSRRGRQWHIGLLVALMALFCASVRAQQPPPAPQPAPALEPQPYPQVAPQPSPQPLTEEELKQLVGPIALYPDALIALILPASTVPSDLVLAARFVASKGDPAQAANQPWDDSVKSLVRYPDIVTWMDQNLEWTTQLGETFLDQPADVMNAIQKLRAQARAAGTLVDTPQQKVVEEKSYIRIVPAEPEVIYVPQYDPEVVFVEPGGAYPYGSYDYGYYPYPYPYDSYDYGYYPYESYGTPYWGPAITFGIGFAVGPWLDYDCDWPRRKVCVGDWNPRWRDDWDSQWRRGPKRDGGDFEVRNTVNVVNINSNTARDWEPSPKIQRQHWQRQRSYNANVSRENFRGRRGEGRDSWRRFSSIERPSRLRLQDQEGDPDRRDWRRSERDRSDSVRDRAREFQRRDSRVRDVTPPPEFDERGSSDSTREGGGRARRDGDARQDFDRVRARELERRDSRVRDVTPPPRFEEQGPSDSTREGRARARRDRETRQDFVPESSDSERPRNRVRDVTPGPQFDQRNEQGATREWRERARRGQDVRESRATPRTRSQSFSREQSRPPSDVRERRSGQESRSIRMNRSTSPNRENFRPQQFKRSFSRAESDSGGQERKRVSSSSGEKRSHVQRAKMGHSKRSDGSRQARSGQSRPRQDANFSRPNRSQQSARVERSGGQSRRPAASYSRQERQQSAGAGGKSRGGGGRQSGDKKGSRDKDKD